MNRFILFILSSILANTLVMGQTIITDRPDQTESPFAVGIGIIQIESGLVFERYHLGNALSAEHFTYPTSLFRIGLAKNLEIRLVHEYVAIKGIDNSLSKQVYEQKGFENLQIGFKYQLNEEKGEGVFGFMGHFILPSGSKGVSNEQYGFMGRLNYSLDIDDKKNISGNIGYSNTDIVFREHSIQRLSDGDLEYTFSYGNKISDRIGVYSELFGSMINLEFWENKMDAGLTYLLRDNIQLDYSFGFGLNQKMNYHSVGISLRLPN